MTTPRGSAMHSLESCLVAIYELGERGRPPSQAQVARRVNRRNATVSKMVGRLIEAGWVDERGPLQLTPRGEEIAALRVRRARLLERLLVNVLDLEPALAKEQALDLARVIGAGAEQKLFLRLGCPTTSPSGAVIPRSADLWPATVTGGRGDHVTASSW